MSDQESPTEMDDSLAEMYDVAEAAAASEAEMASEPIPFGLVSETVARMQAMSEEPAVPKVQAAPPMVQMVPEAEAVPGVQAVPGEQRSDSPDGGYQHHPAFIGAGKQPGLEYWRIEKFEPVKQEQKGNSATFYNGDAYIILRTVGVGSRYSYDLHFWLGKKCAQDESGSAAIRTVELDEYLGGAAVQYREVQGHESKKFLSYYRKGIKYLEGGVASGFTKVEHGKYTKRLFQCKGKHTCRVEQVEVKCASLNLGDVFILDDGPNLYVWVGPKSSHMERIKGMDIARGLRDEEKAGRAHIHIVESDWNTNPAFYKALGSQDKVIRSPDKDDDEIVRKLDQETLLYRVSDDDGRMRHEEIASRPLSQEWLESECCYVLDSGYSGLYVWTGKEADRDFKKKVWEAVNEFLGDRGYPSWVQVSRVVDGGETPLFKQYFPDWHDEGDVTVPMPDSGSGDNVAEQSYEGVDGDTLHGKRPPKAESFMPDDGSGKLTVYRVANDNELVRVPDAARGVFFGGDCYVLQYDYLNNGRPAHIIYFWQGLHADVTEKGASALQAMKLDDDLGGEAVQIRVVMNKEPDHFLKLFDGRLIVFMDGHVNGYRNVKDYDLFNPGEPLLFHIRGNDEQHTRAIQVVCRGASLNSNDIFIAETAKKTFVWVGKSSRESEKDMARYMVQFVSPGRGDPVVVMEGSETHAFWEAIGGEESYYTGIRSQKRLRMPVRLFHCSNSSGRFAVEEVVSFTQEDLDEDDVMMLDTCDEIFVWIGKGANAFEKKEAMKTAYTYLQSDPTGRTADNTLIIVVRQGFEPPQFTGHFHPWDTEKWNSGKTFAEIMAEVGKENAGINLLEDEAKKYTSTYPLDVLQRKIPPEGVDVTRKELYLSDEDFVAVFGMSKESYLPLPAWKRMMLRKERDLF